MSPAPPQKELFARPVPTPGTIFVNDGVCVETEQGQRVLFVHGIVFSHYSMKDRSAEAYANSQMPPKLIRKHCAITAEDEKIRETAIQRLGLSARAHDRIPKASRTIADLEGAPSLAPKHLSEAIQYRTLDRTYWA